MVSFIMSVLVETHTSKKGGKKPNEGDPSQGLCLNDLVLGNKTQVYL